MVILRFGVDPVVNLTPGCVLVGWRLLALLRRCWSTRSLPIHPLQTPPAPGRQRVSPRLSETAGGLFVWRAVLKIQPMHRAVLIASQSPFGIRERRASGTHQRSAPPPRSACATRRGIVSRSLFRNRERRPSHRSSSQWHFSRTSYARDEAESWKCWAAGLLGLLGLRRGIGHGAASTSARTDEAVR